MTGRNTTSTRTDIRPRAGRTGSRVTAGHGATTPATAVATALAAALAVSLAIVLAVSLASVAHAATLFSDDFDTGSAAGWTRSGGSWSVVTDGSGVYRQSGTGSDAKAQAGATWTDQAVQARVNPLAFGGSDRFVGVAARARNMTTYYYLALRADGQVVLGRRGSGGYTTLASAPTTVTPGSWHTVRLEAFGTDLRGYVDGRALLSTVDSTLGSGRVGLVTYYASASFDDVTVTDSAGPGPSPSATPEPSGTPSPTPAPTISPTPTGPPTPTPTPTGSPTPTSPPPVPRPGQPDGYAAVPAMGLPGTTGGVGGPTVTVTTAVELAQYAGANTPYVIEVSGRIQVSGMVTVVADKTIVGLGDTAEIVGGGLQLGTTTRPGNNVIVRNITFRDADDDSISVHNGSHHVWIDHNEFYPGYDGSVDVKRRSSYVTVSWNRFHGTDKSMLLGHSDSFTDDIGYLKVTYHHNYFDGSHQRHPRVRFGEPVHVYNNYYRGIGLYGVVSTENAGVLVEGNYFADVAYPCHSASGYADSGPGRLVQRHNVFVRSGVCETNGTVAEPGSYYSYTLDDAAQVPQIVSAGAGVGRIN
ncbi:pectate lyase [Solwaraspora sp. WMMD406]|uniref:pectate lyase family protein n=1 Tax=Solwaraspora sp. WMMD406 TaxID=3016095 RepID=UPI0024174E8D|nr:pectate lyase [Solwaraspora sp. WMMD406]MDG4764704.1 pectate lyase [Solwaraspora sp. WMMD406]